MCARTRDAQCVYVPYVLSASLEFLRAVARVCGVHVSLLRMWCSVWAVVSCRVTVAWFYCGRGATLAAARETQRLSSKLTGAVAHKGGRSGRWWTTFEETPA